MTVAVRPEKMQLLKGGFNTLRGRVEEVVYIGTDTHYAIALPGDQRVRVREQNTDPASKPLAQVGDDVSLSFAEAAARVLVE